MKEEKLKNEKPQEPETNTLQDTTRAISLPRITYDNKSNINPDPGYPSENLFTAENANEIKSVTNQVANSLESFSNQVVTIADNQNISGVKSFNNGLTTNSINATRSYISFNNKQLYQVAEPTSSSDVTTKNYVDNRSYSKTESDQRYIRSGNYYNKSEADRIFGGRERIFRSSSWGYEYINLGKRGRDIMTIKCNLPPGVDQSEFRVIRFKWNTKLIWFYPTSTERRTNEFVITFLKRNDDGVDWNNNQIEVMFVNKDRPFT